MAFTVEDGTGLDDANSFASVAEYRAYHLERGLTIPSSGPGAQTDAEVQGYLVLACDYLEALYAEDARGVKLEADQALAFPRDAAFDNSGNAIEGVPAKLKAANIEAAYLASQRTLIPNPPAPIDSTAAIAATGAITRKLERVDDVVTEETEYAQPVNGAALCAHPPKYPKIDGLMLGLLRPRCAVRA